MKSATTLSAALVMLAGCSTPSRVQISDEAASFNDPEAAIVCPAGAPKKTRVGRYRDLYPEVESRYPPPPSYVPPRLLQAPKVAYPQNVFGGLRPGFVSVAFLVDPTGAIVQPQVVCSSGEGFEKAAIDAIGTMKYSPATEDGVPKEAVGIQPIVFAPR
jgi:TonB family protein